MSKKTETELDSRIARAKQFAEAEGVTLPDDAAGYLAAITSTSRDLEGYVLRVVAYASLMGTPITAELAGDVIPLTDQYVIDRWKEQLTDEDFFIGYEPSAPGTEGTAAQSHAEVRSCHLCEGVYFPVAGYQLYVESMTEDAAPVWCCRACALRSAPRLTGLLLEGWRLQGEERPRA